MDFVTKITAGRRMEGAAFFAQVGDENLFLAYDRDMNEIGFFTMDLLLRNLDGSPMGMSYVAGKMLPGKLDPSFARTVSWWPVITPN